MKRFFWYNRRTMLRFLLCMVFCNFLAPIKAQDASGSSSSNIDDSTTTISKVPTSNNSSATADDKAFTSEDRATTYSGNSAAPVSKTSQSTENSKYLEDQFYIGLSYNFLLNKPDAVNQRNLSYGLQGGFIKDIPLNTDRTVALGIGLGYGLYSYYSNLRAIEGDSEVGYEVITEIDSLKRSKVETHTFEVPLEFRWRNSTPSEYKFWRVYTGVKFGYVMGGRSKYISDKANNERSSFYNADIRRFQYGLTFNFGYNTFNLHAYYALNNLFEDGTNLEGQPIEMRPLRIGLIFYIL